MSVRVGTQYYLHSKHRSSVVGGIVLDVYSDGDMFMQLTDQRIRLDDDLLADLITILLIAKEDVTQHDNN